MSRLDNRRVFRIRRGYFIIRVDLIAQIGLVCYDFDPECNANQACNCPGLMLISDPAIQADVAKLADALDSGSSGRKVVEVQVLSSALFTKTK